MSKLAAVMIDTFPDRVLSLPAIRRTLRVPSIGKLYLLSDAPFYPGAIFHKIAPIRSLNEYSNLVLRLLPEIVDEEKFFIIQWDGMPVAPQRWDEEFLAYDYIGAPWLNWRGSGEARVGNGGFSLRSRRLLDAIRSLGICVDPADPNHTPEDVLICDVYRHRLEQQELRFAPVEVAQRFSYESGSDPASAFGFHSTFNFPLFFSEDELLGFAAAIIDRQTNFGVLMAYLERLLRRSMHDLLRVSLAGIRGKPGLTAQVVAHVAKLRPEHPLARFFKQQGLT
jgi:hypothetical protein